MLLINARSRQIQLSLYFFLASMSHLKWAGHPYLQPSRERERERIRLLDTFLYYAMELIIYAHICSIDIQNISNEVTSGSDTSSHPSAPGLSKFPDPPDVGFLRLIAIFEDLKLQCMSWYFLFLSNTWNLNEFPEPVMCIEIYESLLR